MQKGEDNLDNIMIRDVITVKPDRPLNELFNIMAEAKLPVAVVDDQKKLKGIIIRGAILAGLVREGYTEKKETTEGGQK